MIKMFFVFLLASSLTIGSMALAQNKLELDDLDIKGEIIGDQRIRFLSRERAILDDKVELRTSFDSRITEGLLKPKPRIIYGHSYKKSSR